MTRKSKTLEMFDFFLQNLGDVRPVCAHRGNATTEVMMYQAPTKEQLLALSDDEKLARFDRIVEKTFSHVDGRDLLHQLHPRSLIDITRRLDGRHTTFEGDWLSDLMWARDGVRT